MKKIDLYNVLISPIVTEKSNTVSEKYEQVVFKVLPNATKHDIKQAFELIFDATVSKVSVVNVSGKVKRFGRFTGKRVNWKKAYICLTRGQNFDLASNMK